VKKELDNEEADKLYRFIPTELITSYLSVFEVRLTNKE